MTQSMPFLWVRLALWELVLNESSSAITHVIMLSVSAGWWGSGTRVRWPAAGVFRCGEWSVCLTTRQDHDWLRIPSVLLTRPDRSPNRTVTCRSVLNTELPAGARYRNCTSWRIQIQLQERFYGNISKTCPPLHLNNLIGQIFILS